MSIIALFRCRNCLHLIVKTAKQQCLQLGPKSFQLTAAL